MEISFEDLASTENPGKSQLKIFVQRTVEFLSYVVDDQEDFGFLWGGNHELAEGASEALRLDVEGARERLVSAIEEIEDSTLLEHGLTGNALRFKFQVIDHIASRWGDVWNRSPLSPFGIRGWLKQMFDAIDALLDSIIQAARGIGGLLKEFKDSLSALVPTM